MGGGVRGYVKAEERELCLHKLEVIQARERGDNHDSGGSGHVDNTFPIKRRAGSNRGCHLSKLQYNQWCC